MVSIILCHHKGNLLDKAIETLKKTVAVEYEIIVVSSVLESDIGDVRVIHAPGQPARKRNIGVKYSKYPYIAFFDDDVEVREDTVYEMFRTCRKKDIGMVFGKLLNFEFRSMFDEAGGFLTWTGFIWARGDRQKDIGQFEVEEEIFAGKSAACMIKRYLYKKIGGFDESFGILGEESDLAWRVIRQGYKVYYSPKSVTYHKFNTRYKPMDFYTIDRVYQNGARNYIKMLLKNAPTRMLAVAFPIHLTAWMIASLGQLVRGRVSASLAIQKGILQGLKSMPKLLAYRNENPPQSFDSLSHLLKNPGVSYFTSRLKNYVKTGLHG